MGKWINNLIGDQIAIKRIDTHYLDAERIRFWGDLALS